MPAAVSFSLALCAAQIDSVIADLRGIANIIFAPWRRLWMLENPQGLVIFSWARQISASMQKRQKDTEGQPHSTTLARGPQKPFFWRFGFSDTAWLINWT
jgi:hypothetical protein